MGNESIELVFNINKDASCGISATLGIPSKGLKEIPFDSVEIHDNFIDFKITSAQANFKGVLKSDEMIIEGKWKEGENTYSLILKPLTEEIDYSKYKRKNTYSLELKLSSENFNFFASDQDLLILDKLSEVLETNLLRILKKVKSSFNNKIDVFIFPNIDLFHYAINYDTAPDWIVGAASVNEIKMVSPLNPGRVHGYESIMQAIVHELAHVIVLNIRQQGLFGLPNWLNEGFAYYEAGQLNETEIENIYTSLLNNRLPSWQELSSADTVLFGDIGGYGFSALIIEFLVKTYGYEKLKEFIIEPKNLENIYRISEEKLEILFLRYLRQHKSK
jgi:hypothetical protein